MAGRRQRRGQIPLPVDAKNPPSHDYWFVTSELTTTAFKLRDQGTILGFLWTLLQPLAMLAVLYWLFRRRVGDSVEHFGLYVLIGIVLWTFFASGTGKGLLSLVSRQDLMHSVTFPRELIVISSILSVIVSSTFEFGVVLLFAIATGAGISWTWLALPIVLLLESMLVVGVGLLLAPLYVYARDLDNIWNILLRIGFFLCPIFYLPTEFLSPEDHRIYMLNPVTQIMTYARQILLDHQWPSALEMGGTFLFCCVVVAIGAFAFRALSADLAEHL